MWQKRGSEPSLGLQSNPVGRWLFSGIHGSNHLYDVKPRLYIKRTAQGDPETSTWGYWVGNLLICKKEKETLNSQANGESTL